MRLEIEGRRIEHPGGLEIAVLGYLGDRGSHVPCQVFLEVYEGQLAIHIWEGKEEDPITFRPQKEE